MLDLFIVQENWYCVSKICSSIGKGFCIGEWTISQKKVIIKLIGKKR